MDAARDEYEISLRREVDASQRCSCYAGFSAPAKVWLAGRLASFAPMIQCSD